MFENIYKLLFFTLFIINLVQFALNHLKKPVKSYQTLKNPVLYLIINNDLKMSKGKILSQVCHLISEIFTTFLKEHVGVIKDWKKKGEAKIVLKASFQNIKDIIKNVENYNNLIDKNSQLKITRIHDAGRTQVAPGSLTVISIGPCEKEIASKFVADLKMY
ncbi:Peptidyl-tRNA hydrolase [Pseudoloma neurophilia]|uniref:peptidyl-tRNA hydrolase n=1 Tax=Pseudoloma neurophilia TaxID=146866 RepID=A0A0R0LZV7_9MICR|nr:Peptidyl-tRNA hydrolase [Pseudoloma neurophilia]